MTNANLTAFQKQAVDKIRHAGGKVFYATDQSWRDVWDQRFSVPAADRKTEGFIGWPTIKALIDADLLANRQGNEYALTGSRAASNDRTEA